jgi:hypothetical protein
MQMLQSVNTSKPLWKIKRPRKLRPSSGKKNLNTGIGSAQLKETLT